MKTVLTLTKREINFYFNSPTAYIFVSVFFLFTNWLFWTSFFIQNQASMREFFNIAPWLLLIMIPALTMRLWAEENKSGTIEQLLTLPITNIQAVAGKFIGCFLFLFLTVILTFSIPFSISLLGNLSWGTVFSGYIYLLLFSATLVALGQLISSLTQNQIAAFMISLILAIVIYLLGSTLITSQLPEIIQVIAVFLGAASHYENGLRGLLDLRDISYFTSLVIVFITLNVVVLSMRTKRTTHSFWHSTTIQAALILALALAFNYLVFLSPLRWDLTENKQNSLSPETINILKELPDIISINTYFSPELPPQYALVKQQAADLLQDMQNSAEGNLVIKNINVAEKATIAQETQTLGIPLLQFNEIERDRFQVSNGYLGMLITYADKKEVLPVINNTNNLEYEIIAATTRLLRETDPVVGIFSSNLETAQDLQELFSTLYTTQLIELTSLNPTTDALKAIIIHNPTDLSKDEIFTLDQLVTRGTGLLITTEGVAVANDLTATPHNTGLDQLLEQIGVGLTNKLVLDSSADLATFNTGFGNIITPYPFWVKVVGEGMKEHITVNRLDTVTLPWVSSLELTPDKENLIPILESSKESFLQEEPFNLSPEQNFKREDLAGPYTLAALYTGGYTTQFKTEDIPAHLGEKEYTLDTENPTAKIMVVGDANFLEPSMLQRTQSNFIFTLNVLDYMTQDERLIGIRSKANLNRPLINFNTETQTNKIKLINMVMPILVILTIGIVRARYRAKKKYVFE